MGYFDTDTATLRKELDTLKEDIIIATDLARLMSEVPDGDIEETTSEDVTSKEVMEASEKIQLSYYDEYNDETVEFELDPNDKEKNTRLFWKLAVVYRSKTIRAKLEEIDKQISDFFVVCHETQRICDCRF